MLPPLFFAAAHDVMRRRFILLAPAINDSTEALCIHHCAVPVGDPACPDGILSGCRGPRISKSKPLFRCLFLSRMDLLSQLQTTVFGKDLEFELTNMEHTVQAETENRMTGDTIER